MKNKIAPIEVIENNPKLIAGIDDATKCPVIGSIFLAGVIADEETIENWKKLGVKDSKLIAFKKREKLAKIIKETAKGFSIKEITPEMIDDKSFNLNDWEMLTVFKVMKKLQSFKNLQEVYVDNWETTKKGFDRRKKSLLKLTLKEKLISKKIILNRRKISSINFIPEHRADENYIIVGAASILAKSASDAQYKKYKKKYGNFGSGNPGDSLTRLFVWQHRSNPLPIIRTSWNTFKVLSQLQNIEDDIIYSRKKHNKPVLTI